MYTHHMHTYLKHILRSMQKREIKIKTAQRAENIEKNRKRAQAAATKRKQAKNK